MKAFAAHIRNMALEQGASLAGFARADSVSDTAAGQFRRWIDRGCHADMRYLDRYHDVRDDARQLLDGARSLIVCLFNYHTLAEPRRDDVPAIAEYALGADYHEVVRERLWQLASILKEQYGGEYRVCVDTAPLRERYWAWRAGLGFIGRNSQLTVPGRGSHFFIGTLVTTLDILPDSPLEGDFCGDCRRCVDACPVGALSGDGTVDARRCLSCVTIESRDDTPGGINIGNHLYGCDDCRLACPHERADDLSDLPEFAPDRRLLTMTADDWRDMSAADFKRLTRHSAMSRVKLAKVLSTLKTISTAK